MQVFKPAWKSKDEQRAVKAVVRITDQKLLARIAVEAPATKARREAVCKLLPELHQPLLAEVAKGDEDSDVRKAAFLKLSDVSVKRSLIAFYGAHLAKYADLLLALYRNEKDSSVLCDIADYKGKVIHTDHCDILHHTDEHTDVECGNCPCHTDEHEDYSYHEDNATTRLFDAQQ